MRPSHKEYDLPQQSGFSLVEIMVGLAIGMFATAVIMQVFSVFEARKQNTTGASDAQVNGSIALFMIEQEIAQAGYPLVSAINSPLRCNVITLNGAASNTALLSPVSIADGVSDSITIRHGDSTTGGIPMAIRQIVAPNIAAVDNNFSCATVGQTAIAVDANGATCEMTTVTAVSGAGVTPISVTLSTPISGVQLACLGTWQSTTFAVNMGNLEINGRPVITGIVNLQAQYGISAAPNSNTIVQWVDPTGATWGTPTTADRNLIKAVRLAIVARNPKQEAAGTVSQGCSSLVASTPTGLCAWAGNATSPAPAIDLTADSSWNKYRYQVFEAIFPLRNVIWSAGAL